MPNRYSPIPPGTDPIQANAIINKNFAELDQQATVNNLVVVEEGNIKTPGVTLAAPGVGNWNSDVGQVFQAHNLGYTPIVIAFLEFGGTYIQLPYVENAGNAGTTARFLTYSVLVDATGIYVRMDLTATGPTPYTYPADQFNVKYYLLQKSAK